MHARGKYVTTHLARIYGARQKNDGSQRATESDDLIKAFVDHNVGKWLRWYMLAASRDLHGLEELLRAVVRLTFEVGLSKNKEEVGECKDIRVGTRLVYRHAREAGARGATLGRRSASVLDRDFVLGTASAESIPTLRIDIELPARQMEKLETHPRILVYLMDSFERCIPLNLDFDIAFCVAERDRSFRLAPRRSERTESDWARLGLTSSLGRGK